MQLGRSLEGSVPAIDGYPAWRRQKGAFRCGSVPQELESTPAMWEGFFLEELLEFIIKTYCTLVGLGARFCCDFQRF
jgi:hypothetical protein